MKMSRNQIKTSMESISRQIDQPKNKKKRISWIENHAEKLLPSKSNIEKIANMSTTPGPLWYNWEGKSISLREKGQ